MASISLAELYFRSLKRTKVLSLLTKYLLQYKRLCIPHVGTFEIVQQSPEFNVVDKLIMPPSFHLQMHNDDFVPEHQVGYLAASTRKDSEQARVELEFFGENLKDKLQNKPFTWNGFGRLSSVAGIITLDPEPISVHGFGQVPAHKAIRENVDHQVLVGDQQMTSQQITSALSQAGHKRSRALLIGWILFILVLLAIVFILYKNGFNPLSTGLRIQPFKLGWILNEFR